MEYNGKSGLNIQEDEGGEPLYPTEIHPTEKKVNEEDAIRKLQDTMDETGELLPTELNFRNERKYAPDGDDNILMPNQY